MFRVGSGIISNCELRKGFFKLSFFSPRIASLASPGQFVHIRCSDLLDPLLRRPFSIHYVEGDNVEVLYQVVGRGTEILAKRKAGEELDVLGPLGKGFEFTGEDEAVIVSGGVGVAPLLFLAQRLTPGRITVLIGARTKEYILDEERFKGLGCSVRIATEDGSCGEKGMVSLLLRDELSGADSTSRPGLSNGVYACGPLPMLKETARICRHFHISCQVSMESQMGCGVGACLGCAILMKTEGGGPLYKRVCLDGPVFDAQEILWE